MEEGKLELTSSDIAEERRQELLRLFPEVRTEGGKIDFARLQVALGETIDAGKERYGMNWPGKSDCFKTIQSPSLGTLRPARDESLDFDTTENLIIEGDNLEVLKLLQKSYAGKVKVVYIDPPYNTGGDFIYPDNYTESLQTYLEYTGQVDARGKKWSTNTEADGRFHSKWLNMMYPRLYLARNLLRKDGVIFVSIDDSESANLKTMLDNCFGEENFIDCIAVEMSTTSGPKTVNAQQGTIVKNVEFVYVYGASEEFESAPRTPLLDGVDSFDTHYSVWLNDDGTLGTLVEALLEDSQVSNDVRQYGLMDRGGFSINNLDKLLALSAAARTFVEANLTKIARVDRPPVSASGQSTQVGRWQRFEADHRTYFLTTLASGNLQALMPMSLNYRMSDDYKPRFGRTVIRGDLWKGFYQDMGNIAKEGDIAFPNGKKPIRLIKQLIKWSDSARDAIILDFFAGSGTTAHAVMQLNAEDSGNRSFIMVQLPEPLDPNNADQKAASDLCDGLGKPRSVAELTKERVRRVMKKLTAEDAGKLPLEPGAKADRGFRVFKLAESNFQTWKSDLPHGDAAALAKQLELYVDHVRRDRQPEDILCEILLKSGFALTTPVSPLTLAGKTVYSVADGALLVCLDKQVTLECIREMAEKAPERVVCLDAGFAGNDQLKANAAHNFRAKGVKSFKTI